jgi:small subunit ribosomal protein S5
MEKDTAKNIKDFKKGKRKETNKTSLGTSFGKPKTVKLSKIKYQEKVVQVKRVTKVVKGGKKMTFRAVIIIGDNKRKVGVGIGRAEDVNLAIDKAILHAKKNLITVPLTIFSSVPHVVEASFGASKIMLRPAALGTGVIAGGSIRTVLELAGINNILAKQFGCNNILNNAKVTILALMKLNEKIELGKAQCLRKKFYYDKIMKKYPTLTTQN